MEIKPENQLTMEEFRAGQLFIHKGNLTGCYKLEISDSGNSFLSNRIRGEFEYFSNLHVINSKFFTYYFFLFGKQIKGKVLFSECIKINI